MRPKKIILCVAADEEKLGRCAFMLGIRGFHVLRAESADAAAELLTDDVELVLLCGPLIEATGLTIYAKRRWPAIRTLAIGFSYQDSPAEICLPNPSPAELLERIKLLLAHRRGPKKKPVQSERAVLDDAIRRWRA